MTLTTGDIVTLDTDYTLSSTTITIAEGETAGPILFHGEINARDARPVWPEMPDQ